MNHIQVVGIGGAAQRALLVVALALPVSFAASNARAGALAHLQESVTAHSRRPDVVLVQGFSKTRSAKLQADANKAIREAKSYLRKLDRAIRKAEQVNRKLKKN